MRHKILLITSILFLAAGLSMTVFGGEVEPETATFVQVITIDTTINPGSADYIIKSMDAAKASGAEALIIELDTPGGLVESTRDIVRALLSPPLPVVVYVSPVGAHAGSAGVMITLAADVAAMAPGTNIGAATPVSMIMPMDDAMQAKATNDISAWVKSIAETRGRNEEWAVKAVQQAAAITSAEALEINVIDFVADDLPTLLEKIDGKEVGPKDNKSVLSTKNARIERVKMSLKHDVFNKLADPNLAFLFIIIGIIGLYIEFKSPGLIVPGVIGAVCIILFLMSTQILPLNTVGLLLLLLGITLLVLEAKFTSYGLLAIGGLTAMAFGAYFLFDVPEKVVNPEAFNFRVAWSYIIPSILAMGGFILLVTYLVVKGLKHRVETGQEGLIGEIGKVTRKVTPAEPGKAEVFGEIWNIEAGEEIDVGQKIIVTEVGRKNLWIRVKKHG